MSLFLCTVHCLINSIYWCFPLQSVFVPWTRKLKEFRCCAEWQPYRMQFCLHHQVHWLATVASIQHNWLVRPGIKVLCLYILLIDQHGVHFSSCFGVFFFVRFALPTTEIPKNCRSCHVCAMCETDIPNKSLDQATPMFIIFAARFSVRRWIWFWFSCIRRMLWPAILLLMSHFEVQKKRSKQ